MAGSLLDGLRYGSFMREEESSSAFGSQTEGRTGVPRFNGEPGKYNEWKFRVKARQRKEKQMPEEELKKAGHLGLRLLEGLSGHALQLVQLMDMNKIDDANGADYLLNELETKLRPRRQQQARELYEAGARVGGYLSRQGQEPMVEYILRRRAWYQQLCDLSSELKLPDTILAEQLLDNSNISEDHKLLVRVTLQQKMTFDAVADELVNQHGRTHERFSTSGPPRRSFPDGRGTWKPHWQQRVPKGPAKGTKGRSYAFLAEPPLDEEYGDYGDEVDYDAAPEGFGYMSHGDLDETTYSLDFDSGNFAEEHLAYLLDNGLDPEDTEAGHFAADVIQAEEEAFWSRKGASSKGHAPMKPPPFEISGTFSMDEKKAKLLQLKARTTCRKCGNVGHWSGDAQCPLNKGKGKTKNPRAGAPSSSLSSTGWAGRGHPPGRGTSHAGRGSGKDKPRTVYFSIKEGGNEAQHGYLAFRTPDRGRAGYNAVPPPSSLTTPPATTTAPTVSRDYVDLTDENAYPEDRYYMDPAAHHQGRRQEQPESRGGTETAITTSTWELVTAEQNLAYSYEAPDVDMDILLEALRPDPAGEASTTFSPTIPLEDRRPQPAIPLEDRRPQPQPHVANEEPAPSTSTPEPPLTGTPATSSTTTTSPAPPLPNSTRRTCAHSRTTTVGSNQHYFVRKCALCGEVLERTKKQTTPTTSTPSAPAAGRCQHHRVHWKGSNGYVRVRTCVDCGHREVFPNNPGATTAPAASTTTAAPSSSTSTFTSCPTTTLSREEVQLVVQTFNEAVARKMAQNEAGDIPADRLLQALRLTIDQVTVWKPPRAQPQAPRAPEQPTAEERLQARGATLADAGKYKGQSYLTAYHDRNYRDWCFEYINDRSHPAMKRMVQFFKEYDNHLGQPRAYMATEGPPDDMSEENDLVAILDTWCSQTCHGDRNRRIDAYRRGPAVLNFAWRAPLLLSLRAQQALGLVLDLNAEVAHSQLLGKDLKLVIKDGLLGLRLLPADLAGEPTVDIDTETGDHTGNPDGNGNHNDGNHLDHSNGQDSEDDRGNDTHHYPDTSGESGAYLAIDSLRHRPMTKSMVAKVGQGVKDVGAADRILWNQLFAGAAVLSHAAAYTYGLPISSPIDIHHGPGHSLFHKDGRDAVDRIIEKDDPYVITCLVDHIMPNPWATLSQPGASWQDCVRERRKWTPVIEWLQGVARKRLEKGRQVLLEHPWGHSLWTLPLSRSFLQGPPVDESTGEPLETIFVKDTHGGGENTRAYLTATSPLKERLVQQKGMPEPQPLIDTFLTALDNVHVETAFPAEAEIEDELFEEESTNPGNLDGIFSDTDLSSENLGGNTTYGNRRLAEQMDTIAEETEEPPLPDEEAAPLLEARAAWRKLPREQRVALRRLHTMTGHSSPAAMQRLLRTANADPEAIKALNHFYCPACSAMQRPREPRPVKIPHDYIFNKDVAVDVFVLKDARGIKFKFLSAVDNGTLFHAAWLVGEGPGPPSSTECTDKFRDGWLSWAGPPEAISLDRGTENRGKFQAMAKGERQGSILKDIMKRVVAARQLTGREAMEMLVTEATSVKNNRLHHAGFTPSQWVLGRLPTEVDSLTATGSEKFLGQQQEIEDGETAFAKRMALCGAAREAFAQTDSSDRVRSALLRKSVPMRGPFVQGDLVCFYRRAGRGPFKWHGPARVMWVVHGGIPMTVSMENCRYATGSEAYAKRQLELRPSRKRRREDLAEHDPEEHGYPFGDDLSGGVISEGNQRNYFDYACPE
ncbi:unnamed protein product, partial [Symbiodinium necroappetens]